MLSLKTDIENKSWLVYILNEFKKINLLQDEIEVIDIDSSACSSNILYFLQKPNSKLSIFNSHQIEPNGKIKYIQENLYVLDNSIAEGFDVNYDIFWNAFVFLSRYEEYKSEQNGKLIYSYSLNHPREDKSSFLIPIVNIIFNELEAFLILHYPDLKFGERVEPYIELSHDVDYIEKTLPLRLKQTAFNGYNTLKAIAEPKIFIKKIIKTFCFLFSSPSYWCFDYWQKIENTHNKKSTFYVYAKVGKVSFRKWLLDPSYDIANNKILQKKLKQLNDDGFEIGLHGSYESANDFEKLKHEKETLEKALGFEITKTRQHWLNYFEDVTPYSHSKLFKFDSTLAWNDIIGFRSGIASKYKPFDFKEEKAFDHQIIPQIIMDSNVYDYANDERIYEKARNILTLSKTISKNTYVSISWHQRVCSADYNWHLFYEDLLSSLK
jgi:hypothetical protein